MKELQLTLSMKNWHTKYVQKNAQNCAKTSENSQNLNRKKYEKNEVKNKTKTEL